MRTTRAARWILALVLAGAGCGAPATDVAFTDTAEGGEARESPAPAAAPGAATSPAATASSQAVPASAAPSAAGRSQPSEAPSPEHVRELGSDENAELGRPYRYRLLTHCGIVATWWNGKWWDAAPPQHDGNGNPPPGWDNPHQDGVMVQVSAGRLEFTGDRGQRAAFAPRPPENGAPPACD